MVAPKMKVSHFLSPKFHSQEGEREEEEQEGESLEEERQGVSQEEEREGVSQEEEREEVSLEGEREVVREGVSLHYSTIPWCRTVVFLLLVCPMAFKDLENTTAYSSKRWVICCFS